MDEEDLISTQQPLLVYRDGEILFHYLKYSLKDVINIV